MQCLINKIVIYSMNQLRSKAECCIYLTIRVRLNLILYYSLIIKNYSFKQFFFWHCFKFSYGEVSCYYLCMLFIFRKLEYLILVFASGSWYNSLTTTACWKDGVFSIVYSHISLILTSFWTVYFMWQYFNLQHFKNKKFQK